MAPIQGYRYTTQVWRGDMAHGCYRDFIEFWVEGLVFSYSEEFGLAVVASDEPRNQPSGPDLRGQTFKGSDLEPVDFFLVPDLIANLKVIVALKAQVKEVGGLCTETVKTLYKNVQY